MNDKIKSEYDNGEYVQMGNLKISNSFIKQLAELDEVDEDTFIADVMGYPHSQPNQPSDGGTT